MDLLFDDHLYGLHANTIQMHPIFNNAAIYKYYDILK